MKRILVFIFCGLILLGLIGCSNQKNDKTLRLNHEVDLLGLQPNDIVKEKKENLKISGLPEVLEKNYEEETYLDLIVDYIKKNFDININNKWKYSINYYDDEKTSGMIQFIYVIGNEIKTNKMITFGYEDGYIKYIYYSCLDSEIDENNLIERVKKFKENYVQEKPKLKGNEKIENEETSYGYLYNVDKLIYSYAIYIKTNNGIINNDNNTSYFIDNNGNIIS